MGVKKKKNIIIIITIIIIIAMFLLYPGAETLFNRPAQKYLYKNKEIEYRTSYQTKKEQKDFLLYLKNSKINNPEIEEYDTIKHIVLYENLGTSKYPFDDSYENKQITTSFDIYGECNEYYQIIIDEKVKYIKKTKIDEELTNILCFDKCYEIENKYKNCIEAKGEITKEYIDYANEYWNIIPLEIRKELVDNNWNIYITDEKLSNENGKLSGLIFYEDKKIFIKNTRKDIRESVIHEVGHAYDYINNITDDIEFVKIYNIEKKNFKNIELKDNNYYTENIREYFAENFKYYIIFPEYCKTNVEKTYNYLEKKLANKKDR